MGNWYYMNTCSPRTHVREFHGLAVEQRLRVKGYRKE